MAKTHYIYGSGMPGCLYDYGPNYAATAKDAIEDLLTLFGDSLASDNEETELRAALSDGNGSHYFQDPHGAGASYCEISTCDCDNPGEHMDEPTDPGDYTISLDNLDDLDGCVMVSAEGEGVQKWAKFQQTIGGSRWECARDMPNYAYAMPCDHAGLVAELEAEGYVLNLDDYSPPSEPAKATE